VSSVDDDNDDVARLHLPHENADEWARVRALLERPLTTLGALDALLSELSPAAQRQTCTFFAQLERAPHAKFDHAAFLRHAVPFMQRVALDLPTLFAPPHAVVPLLLKGRPDATVTLSRRQVACLLAHSVFGSITADAVRVEKKKWAFRAAQLFFLQANPSTFCVLNYFCSLATRGVPDGALTYTRLAFPRGCPPWSWDDNATPLCAIELLDSGSIYASPCASHVAFANKFVGGGCLENDFASEEMLFVTRPELIVAMALCSHMTDEDCVLIGGALPFSATSGYGATFEFEGDVADAPAARGPPPTVIEIDALQGAAKIQFQEGLVRRDLNKARLGFSRCQTLATGFWGCGAFGNDHWLKFLQQWLAASDAGVAKVSFYTFGDKRADGLAGVVQHFAGASVGELWRAVLAAARQCATPGPGNSAKFRAAMIAHASSGQS